MRWLVLATGLCLSPAAHATGGTALPTFLFSLAGGLGGAVIGAPIYGAIDPYGSDDGLEWLAIGVPLGFGVGAAIGGTTAHALFGGGQVWAVALVSGGLAVAGSTLLAMTPGLYDDFADDRFAAAYVTGAVINLALVPVGATLASLFTKKRKGGDEVALAVLPTGRGLVVTGRL